MKTTREERAKFRGANGIGVPYHTFIWACIDDIEELLDMPQQELQTVAKFAVSQSRELRDAQQQLHEMTMDRNLWRDAHNEDCPNYFALDAAQQQAVEANERAAKFEKRATAYRNLLVQIAQERDQYLGIDYSRMIANLDKLLAQEEAQEKK